MLSNVTVDGGAPAADHPARPAAVPPTCWPAPTWTSCASACSPPTTSARSATTRPAPTSSTAWARSAGTARPHCTDGRLRGGASATPAASRAASTACARASCCYGALEETRSITRPMVDDDRRRAGAATWTALPPRRPGARPARAAAGRRRQAGPGRLRHAARLRRTIAARLERWSWLRRFPHAGAVPAGRARPNGRRMSPPAPSGNAMTVDVEDYFQVQAFAGVLAAATGTAARGASSATPTASSPVRGAGVQATFFTLGWVAERHPALIRRIVAGGHELASHGHGHRWSTALDADAFRADVPPRRARLEDAGGVAVARLPRAHLLDRPAHALGLRRAGAGTGHATAPACSRSGTTCTATRTRRASPYQPGRRQPGRSR